MFTAKADKKFITISVSPKQHKKLEALASEARMKPALYSQLLFEAAFAARCGLEGDRSIDAQVSRVALLWGAGLDEEVISRELGVSTGTVNRILTAWQDEVLGRVA